MCTNWTRTHVQKIGSLELYYCLSNNENRYLMQCTMVENRLESRTKATLHYIVFPVTFQ